MYNTLTAKFPFCKVSRSINGKMHKYKMEHKSGKVTTLTVVTKPRDLYKMAKFKGKFYTLSNIGQLLADLTLKQ